MCGGGGGLNSKIPEPELQGRNFLVFAHCITYVCIVSMYAIMIDVSLQIDIKPTPTLEDNTNC